MFTHLKQHNKKSTFGKFLIAMFILASASTTQAQIKAVMDSTKDQALITYLGSEEDMYKFGIEYVNTSGNKFLLEIKDSDGDVLYKEIYSDTNFSKKFLIPKDLDNTLKIVFRNFKNNDVQAFEINTSLSTREEVAVKEID